MIYLNNVFCDTLEQLELEMTKAGISDEQKAFLRNDFNGIPNAAITDAVPRTITPRQARKALLSMGITKSQVEAIIDALPEPTKSYAYIEWEYSIEFQRNNPILNSLAPQLGLSSTDLDNLFKLGSTL